MKISRDKVNICMARKKMTMQSLAMAYEVSRNRIGILHNQSLIVIACRVLGRNPIAMEHYR